MYARLTTEAWCALARYRYVMCSINRDSGKPYIQGRTVDPTYVKYTGVVSTDGRVLNFWI